MEYHEIIEALSSNKPFALARYGDGEFLCMAGTKGANTDDHRYYDSLGVSLWQTIAEPMLGITYAIQNMMRRNRKIKAFLAKHSKVEKWTDADVLHRQSRDRSIDTLFHQLRIGDSHLVGPKRFEALSQLMVPSVRVPDRNCWLVHKKTVESIRKDHRPGRRWILCTGMSAAVIIYDLVDELEDATFIDVGSLFEPYVGNITRIYHREVVRRIKKQGRPK